MLSDWSNVDADLRFLPSWLMLERWLRTNDPARGSGLRPGATEEDILTVEQIIGIALPAAVRFAYLRHNGEERDSFGLFRGWRWLPLLQVAHTWLGWQRQFADDRPEGDRRKKASRRLTRDKRWDPLRVPLTFNGGRCYHCIDLQPEDGAAGRIVEFEFASEEVVAQSFEEWLAISFADLAGGKWEFGMYGDLIPGRGGTAEPDAAPDRRA